MFWRKLFGKKASTIATISLENTVIYSVLGQAVCPEGWSHCGSMGRNHCNLQCFGTSCLARRLEPLLQQREETLYFTGFWSKLFAKKA